MIMSIAKGLEVKETAKAYGVPFKHNGILKIMWLPKSQVFVGNKSNMQDSNSVRTVDIPDWLYDKKVSELFL